MCTNLLTKVKYKQYFVLKKPVLWIVRCDNLEQDLNQIKVSLPILEAFPFILPNGDNIIVLRRIHLSYQ